MDVSKIRPDFLKNKNPQREDVEGFDGYAADTPTHRPPFTIFEDPTRLLKAHPATPAPCATIKNNRILIHIYIIHIIYIYIYIYMNIL